MQYNVMPYNVMIFFVCNACNVFFCYVCTVLQGDAIIKLKNHVCNVCNESTVCKVMQCIFCM